MTLPRILLAVLLATWPVPGSRTSSDVPAAGRQLDAMASLDRWSLSGPAIPDRLGRSTLFVTTMDPPEGQSASLEVVGDFHDTDRAWIAMDYDGPPIAGRCRRIALSVWTGGAGASLGLVVSDALGAWFEHDVTVPAVRGWHRLHVDIGAGSHWKPLLRRGEMPRPFEQPLTLRRIRLMRPQAGSDSRLVCRFADLRAECDISAMDLLEARISTGRVGNLFGSGERPSVEVRLTNRADRPLQAVLTLSVAAFPEDAEDRADVSMATRPAPITLAKRAIRTDLGTVSLAPGAGLSRRVDCPTSVYGPHEVTLTVRDVSRTRRWVSRFAYIRASDVPNRRTRVGRRGRWASPSRFGICGNVGGFRNDLGAVAPRLNRLGGAGWSRVGLAWQQINMAPNVWVWNPPSPVEGPVGTALRTSGRPYRAPHDPTQDCPDEVTLAFWARISGPNGAHQAAVRKWGAGDRRNYGAYFERETGAFTFSAGYQKLPGRVADISAGVGAFDGQWHHYAATYSRHIRSVCLYVDGALITTADHDGGRLRTTSADLVIGQDLAGDIDEVMIYRRALGPADIAALARRADPPRDGLAAWYDFNDQARIGRNAVGSAARSADLVPDEPDGVISAREAASQGMSTLAILGFPTADASSRPGAERFWLHEPEPNAWMSYVYMVARQYRDRIAHWEIWNEPNTEAFWQPRPDPERYLYILKIAYNAAKRGNPRSTVLMPGLRGPSGKGSAEGRAFLDRLLGLGAGRYCDAISIHPYRAGTPEETDLVGDLRWIARRCAVNGVRHPLWITEIGWPTSMPDGVTPRMQAALLARSYILAASTGLVERFFWFRLHDSGPDRTYAEDNYGLCEEDMTPKPAFFAHRTVAVLLGDARPDGSLTVGSGVYAPCFRSPTERYAAIWHPEQPEWVALNVGKRRVAMTDLMGNSRLEPCPHGVLLVQADDLPVFVRGISATAKAQAGLIAAVGQLPKLVLPADRSALAAPPYSELRVRVRNPYPVTVQVTVTARAMRGIEIGVPVVKIAIPANGASEVRLRVRASRAAKAGEYPLVVAAQMPGGAITARLTLTTLGPAEPRPTAHALGAPQAVPTSAGRTTVAVPKEERL